MNSTLLHCQFEFRSVYQKQSNQNAPWVYYMQPSLALIDSFVSRSQTGFLYTYTAWGLHALLVSINWAVLEPLRSETSCRMALRFFHLYVNARLTYLGFGASRIYR